MLHNLMNRTGWVYVGNARGGDGGFILPNGGVKRIELPVKVGRAYRVAINEIQCPNTGTGKGFHRIPADAADAEYCNPQLTKPSDAINSDKRCTANKERLRLILCSLRGMVRIIVIAHAALAIGFRQGFSGF